MPEKYHYEVTPDSPVDVDYGSYEVHLAPGDVARFPLPRGTVTVYPWTYSLLGTEYIFVPQPAAGGGIKWIPKWAVYLEYATKETNPVTGAVRVVYHTETRYLDLPPVFRFGGDSEWVPVYPFTPKPKIKPPQRFDEGMTVHPYVPKTKASFVPTVPGSSVDDSLLKELGVIGKKSKKGSSLGTDLTPEDVTPGGVTTGDDVWSPVPDRPEGNAKPESAPKGDPEPGGNPAGSGEKPWDDWHYFDGERGVVTWFDPSLRKLLESLSISHDADDVGIGGDTGGWDPGLLERKKAGVGPRPEVHGTGPAYGDLTTSYLGGGERDDRSNGSGAVPKGRFDDYASIPLLTAGWAGEDGSGGNYGAQLGEPGSGSRSYARLLAKARKQLGGGDPNEGNPSAAAIEAVVALLDSPHPGFDIGDPSGDPDRINEFDHRGMLTPAASAGGVHMGRGVAPQISATGEFVFSALGSIYLIR